MDMWELVHWILVAWVFTVGAMILIGLLFLLLGFMIEFIHRVGNSRHWDEIP